MRENPVAEAAGDPSPPDDAPAVNTPNAASNAPTPAPTMTIPRVRRAFSPRVWLISLLLVSTGAVGMIVALLGGHPSKSRETSVEELLQPGTHCYSTSPERDTALAAARAAIDRLHLQQVQALHRSSTGSPAAIPTVSDAVAAGQDPALCFVTEIAAN